MDTKLNFNHLKTSWTKYDIVQVMEVIENIQVIEKYIKKEVSIDEPILRSFLGIKTLNDPIPSYWHSIQNFPNERNLFALFAIIFSHVDVINLFVNKYSTGNMKGVFNLEDGKLFTNIRSALIESTAAQTIYRRKKEVPYDFSPIFYNGHVGKLFKQLLKERISRITNADLNQDSIFYDICNENNFYKVLSLSDSQFKSWLEGNAIFESSYISKVQITNFFSITNMVLDFKNAKEIYFLGENGDGKSLILLAIYLAFNGSYITEKTDQEKTGKASDIIRSNKETMLSGIDDRDRDFNPHKIGYLNNIFGYGTHRGRYSTDDAEEYGFMTLFDNNQMLINPESWLKDRNAIELEANIQKKSGEISDSELYSLSVSYLKKIFYELLEKNVEIIIEKAEVFFIEKGAKLRFNQLSEGYKSVIIFVSDLIFRLLKNNNQIEDAMLQQGIVLVDEIDLHLHPKWQRSIISKLRKLFPNIQFIFTTHSPSMIQGASDDSFIYRVYRNKDTGKTQVSDPYIKKDLNHLMVNSLLTSPLFGLNDSRLKKDNDDADTSETYLLYRINKILEDELKNKNDQGKQFISDEEIDDLIQDIISKDLG